MKLDLHVHTHHSPDSWMDPKKLVEKAKATGIIPAITEAFRRIIATCKSFRDLGTAGVEYARLARGQLHGIVTPIAESVHAAGYLLMHEAGALVTDMGGMEAGLQSKTIVAANPALHPKLLQLMHGIEFHRTEEWD